MEEKQIGKITHYFAKISVAVLELTDSLKAGETIHIVGGDRDFNQIVDSMQVEHQTIGEAKSGDAVGMKVDQMVKEGDAVYKEF
jgi:U32 family peptidase